MRRFKTITIGLAALTLAATLAATLSAGAVAGGYSDPAFRGNAGYDECRFVDQTDGLGTLATFKICDVVPY
jgi:hypothetical protein